MFRNTSEFLCIMPHVHGSVLKKSVGSVCSIRTLQITDTVRNTLQLRPSLSESRHAVFLKISGRFLTFKKQENCIHYSCYFLKKIFFSQIFHVVPHSSPKRKHLIAPIFSLCPHENHKTFTGWSNVGRVSAFFRIYRLIPEDAISSELVT